MPDSTMIQQFIPLLEAAGITMPWVMAASGIVVTVLEGTKAVLDLNLRKWNLAVAAGLSFGYCAYMLDGAGDITIAGLAVFFVSAGTVRLAKKVLGPKEVR